VHTHLKTAIEVAIRSNDDRVEDHAPMLVVSIGLQGAYGYDRYQENVAKLRQWLDNHPDYEIAGEPREFFYDLSFGSCNFRLKR